MTTQGSKVLVANLGSTSFKFRLFDMGDSDKGDQRQLARGAIDRIGSDHSSCVIDVANSRRETTAEVADHGAALRICLDQLASQDCLTNANEIVAIGFKAVHGGRYSGVQRVTDDVLLAMEEMNTVAPAHNPPYIRAMRQLAEQFPEIPLVAAFETGFHATIPERLRSYAIPHRWTQEYHVRRWGFHGASHRFIAERIAELMGKRDLRIISCHLGGSSSLCAIRNGKSVATTMGMSPQSGLPQNNRVGDFDPFAIPLLMQKTGFELPELLDRLANEGGLLGVSGVSSDLRDIEQAASQGNAHAQLALELYTTDIRRHLGGLWIELGGADVLVFTGGIGENSVEIRAAVCADLTNLGLELDAAQNLAASGERDISTADSCTRIWVVPTNEEIIVARQAFGLIRE